MNIYNQKFKELKEYVAKTFKPEFALGFFQSMATNLEKELTKLLQEGKSKKELENHAIEFCEDNLTGLKLLIEKECSK